VTDLLVDEKTPIFTPLKRNSRLVNILKKISKNTSAARGSAGAWQRFERGELGLQQFYEEFGRDLSDTAKGNIWYTSYCQKRGLGKLHSPLSIFVSKKLMQPVLHLCRRMPKTPFEAQRRWP
jgi:hypothetical protein